MAWIARTIRIPATIGTMKEMLTIRDIEGFGVIGVGDGDSVVVVVVVAIVVVVVVVSGHNIA